MTTMSASALIVMAVIMVAALATWLSLVFLAARAPRQHETPARQPTKMQKGCPAGSANV
jgi:hypothetical protein